MQPMLGHAQTEHEIQKAQSSTQQQLRKEAVKKQPIKKRVEFLNFPAVFGKDLNVKSFFEVVKLDEEQKDSAKKDSFAIEEKVGDGSSSSAQSVSQSSTEPPSEHANEKKADADPILPPDQTPAVRVNPEAPSPVKAMIGAMREGDDDMAQRYASQFLRYQQDYFFELNSIIRLLTEAMVKEGVVDEENVYGLNQRVNYEMALTRKEMGDMFRPTNSAALRRIKADPKKQVEVFYFFSLNCSWCRYMAPDIERLWRAVKDDPRVKMTALTLGETPQDWLKEYRDYTDMTMPILNGEDVAKALDIAYVPALVILSPNSKKAYSKTGQQDFPAMYQFLRTVQGLEITLTPELERLVRSPIGEAEKNIALKNKSSKIVSVSKKATVSGVNINKVNPNAVNQVVKKSTANSLDRF